MIYTDEISFRFLANLLVQACSIIATVLSFFSAFVGGSEALPILQVFTSDALQYASWQQPVFNSTQTLIYAGFVGSCSRNSTAFSFACTNKKLFNPTYDLSQLPSDVPGYMLAVPPGEPALWSTLIGFLMGSYALFTFASLRKGDTPRRELFKLVLSSISLGFQFRILFSLWWIDVDILHFNLGIMVKGSNAPEFVAQRGIGYTVALFLFAFIGVPFALSFLKFFYISGDYHEMRRRTFKRRRRIAKKPPMHPVWKLTDHDKDLDHALW